MKRKAHPMLSEDGQHAPSQSMRVLQQFEDLSAVTIYLSRSDLCQLIARCECCYCEEQEKCCFTPQAVAPSLLVRYREFLQITLRLRPSTISRTCMSLKRHFSWTRKTCFVESDPTPTCERGKNVSCCCQYYRDPSRSSDHYPFPPYRAANARMVYDISAASSVQAK
jgi:hypothetical protein